MTSKCVKIPFRAWIAVMIFLIIYASNSTRVVLSISIVSMVGGDQENPDPYCKQEATSRKYDNESNTTKFESLPNYGPRYDWSENMEGIVMGAHSYGYVLPLIFGGVVSEWIGPFRVIFCCLLSMQILNSLCVWAPAIHVAVLVLCRLLMGILTAFVYPACQKLIANWAPPTERSKFVSTFMGGNMAMAITWPAVGIATVHLGWMWGFHMVTIQGIILCGIFYLVASDRPENSRHISEEELNYILEAQGGTISKKKLVPPYLKIFKTIPFWVLAIAHFGSLWGLYVQLITVPKFLFEVVGFKLENVGEILALPHLCRIMTGMLFGVIDDYLITKTITTNKFNRKFFTIFSHVLPGICLALIAVTKCSAAGSIILLVVSMGLNGATCVTNLRNPQDLAPNFAATIFGMVSFIGGVTGFIVPSVLGALINENSTTKEWGIHFLIGGSIYIFTGCVFILFGSVELQPWNEVRDKEPE